MAYDSTNNVAVGDKTKKSHYDQCIDNAEFIRDNVLGVNTASDANTAIRPTFRDASTILIEGDNSTLTVEGAGTAGDGAGFVLYGEDEATNPGRFTINFGGDGVAVDTGEVIFVERASANGGTRVTVNNTGLLMGRDSANAELPIAPVADGRDLILRGSPNGAAAGCQLSLGSDSGSSSAVLRLSSTDVFRIEDSGGNHAFVFDDSGSNPHIYSGLAGASNLDITAATIDLNTSDVDFIGTYTVQIDADTNAIIFDKDTDAVLAVEGAFSGNLDCSDFESVIIGSGTALPGTAVTTAVTGALYFETDAKKLWAYDGSSWVGVTLA